jgi:transglutaminase-like putative cysteine protease
MHRWRKCSYVDRYGNDVHHFAILPSHDTLSIVTRSTVVTMLEDEAPEPVQATRALLESDALLLRPYDFQKESTYVRFTPEIETFWHELELPDDDIGTWCRNVSRHINRTFVYDKDATTVRSTVREALARRAGVCQDFAHVMIAVLRSAGVPARYASGYIFSGDSRVLGAEASHAWCEAYLPPYGWVGFDPTNDLIVNQHFVKIAIGRDYRDVSPVRGVYRGSDYAEMSVNVAMDVLASAQQQR